MSGFGGFGLVACDFISLNSYGTSVKLYTRSEGDGETILFIHGWMHSGEIWSLVMRRLAPYFKTIAVDLPGFGRSPALEADNIELDFYADLMLELIRKLSVKEQIRTIVADSLGAIIVLKKISILSKMPVSYVFTGCPADGLSAPASFLGTYGLLSNSIRFMKIIPKQISGAAITAFLPLTTVSSNRNVHPLIAKAVSTLLPNTSSVLSLFSTNEMPLSLDPSRLLYSSDGAIAVDPTAILTPFLRKKLAEPAFLMFEARTAFVNTLVIECN